MALQENRNRPTGSGAHLPGKPWDGVEIVEIKHPADEQPCDQHDSKSQTRHKILGVVGVLFTAHAVFAMLTSNQEMVAETFQLVRYAVIAAVCWAFGKSTPQPQERPP